MLQRVWFVLLVLALLLPQYAFASSPAYLKDFSQRSFGGQYTFVMLIREGKDAYNPYGYIDKDEELRARYPQSGLYRTDDPSRALWTVDWNAHQVALAPDGHHLVRWGPSSFIGSSDQSALEFYRDGTLIKRYQVSGLIGAPFMLLNLVGTPMWLKDSGSRSSTDLVWLELVTGRHYAFDMTTGEIVEGSLPNNLLGMLMLIAPIALIAGLIIYLRKEQTIVSPRF